MKKPNANDLGYGVVMVVPYDTHWSITPNIALYPTEAIHPTSLTVWFHQRMALLNVMGVTLDRPTQIGKKIAHNLYSIHTPQHRWVEQVALYREVRYGYDTRETREA